MSCEKFEELLPLYVEGGLANEDRRSVDDHLAACGRCRESLAFYEELESALVSRRDSRPPAARTASAVVERLGLRARRRPIFGWIGAPGFAGAGLAVVGVVMYFFRGAVTEFFVRLGEQTAAGHSRIAAEWTQGLVQAAAGNEWMLLSIYLGVFAFVMLAGSWMVVKFVRE